jgi:hypothetical protein
LRALLLLWQLHRAAIGLAVLLLPFRLKNASHWLGQDSRIFVSAAAALPLLPSAVVPLVVSLRLKKNPF